MVEVIEKDGIELIMDNLVRQVSRDDEGGIARFLQANPYSAFEYYNFSILKDNPMIFEDTLYCESSNSEMYKKQICNILENPNGKNTFFLVGYQGCGKSTFIHSVINSYIHNTDAKVVLLDCDKNGKSYNHIKNVICKLLKKTINNSPNISDFIDFYNINYDVIEDLNDDIYYSFFNLLNNINKLNYNKNKRDFSIEISQFINSKLSIKEALYLLIFWNLANNYRFPNKAEEKLMIFIDNLDCIDAYNELSEFVSCIDSLTVDFSEIFEKIKLCHYNTTETFVSKIKIFIAMRETTKANLPLSHFSDAFRSIYINKDMTEWYNKSDIIENRIKKLQEYDKKGYLTSKQQKQLELLLIIIKDSYTQNVFYPLFNNNYRLAVNMLVNAVISHTNDMETYVEIMKHGFSKYKHGARGILFKCIFDEFNKSNGNEESCFKRIGVIDLLNRKSNSVSVCRLILSYLSNYTETKCDSGKNSIALQDILQAFVGIFPSNEVKKILCEMFALRDSIWTHLVSFNQIEYKDSPQKIDSYIDVNSLDSEKTMLHYSCAGKVYIEYVATHFEFFTARIYKEHKKALFCNDNLKIDSITNNFKCYDIINKVYEEVKNCCNSLKKFNISLCKKNNLLNPYNSPKIYIDTPYICMFKRIDYDGKERRFKQFHEERIVLTHINYIDCYRLYILNYSNILNYEQKLFFNEKITECITKYVDLLESENVLKNQFTNTEFVEHYRKQVESLQDNWSDFKTIISKTNKD